MDRQAIYNTVRDHLLSLDRQAGIERGDGLPFRCQYLDAQGRRCAIGPLIPDGHEGLTARGDVVELLEEYPDLADLWDVSFDDTDDTDFLLQLQEIHDDGDNWDGDGLNEDGRLKLNLFAATHGLERG